MNEVVPTFDLASLARKHPYALAEMAYAKNLWTMRRFLNYREMLAQVILVILVPCTLTVRTPDNLIIPGQPSVPLLPGTLVFQGIVGCLHLDP